MSDTRIVQWGRGDFEEAFSKVKSIREAYDLGFEHGRTVSIYGGGARSRFKHVPDDWIREQGKLQAAIRVGRALAGEKQKKGLWKRLVEAFK